MKYILIELPNETPEGLLEGLAEAIRSNLKLVGLSNCVVRFGSLFTSL